MMFANRTLSLIRHAPSTPHGRLYGRTDADIISPTKQDIERLAPQLADASAIYSSPAKRCLKSCASILPDRPAPKQIDAFWEQNFGDWEDTAYDELPDIGDLYGAELADFRPPLGESFSDICARVIPTLNTLLAQDKAEHIAIFAHAGVIRAILSFAFESQIAALKCTIETLSITQFHILADGKLSVISVNSTR